jgi:hypothetical protein
MKIFVQTAEFESSQFIASVLRTDRTLSEKSPDDHVKLEAINLENRTSDAVSTEDCLKNREETPT